MRYQNSNGLKIKKTKYSIILIDKYCILLYNVTWNIVEMGVAFDCIQTNKKAVLIVGAINTNRRKRSASTMCRYDTNRKGTHCPV